MKEKQSKRETGIIVACDLQDKKSFAWLLEKTKEVRAIKGYKIGFALGLSISLPEASRMVRDITGKKVIYDHQKGATDIPDTGELFADIMKNSGVDSAILFPLSGPATMEEWIKALREREIEVITGGIMTHRNYLRSEGGFLDDSSVIDIYIRAYGTGIRNFVAPGTRPEKVREIVEKTGKDINLYLPGFRAQGGVIKDFKSIAVSGFFPIVGRAISGSTDPAGAAEEFSKEMEELG